MCDYEVFSTGSKWGFRSSGYMQNGFETRDAADAAAKDYLGIVDVPVKRSRKSSAVPAEATAAATEASDQGTEPEMGQ